MCRYAAERRTDADLERMKAALDSFTADADHDDALEADLQFHVAVAEASHNPFFEHLVVPINRQLRSAYRSSLGYEAARQQTADEHRRIAEVIERRLPDETSRLMRAHLERVHHDRRELVTDSPEENDE